MSLLNQGNLTHQSYYLQPDFVLPRTMTQVIGPWGTPATKTGVTFAFNVTHPTKSQLTSSQSLTLRASLPGWVSPPTGPLNTPVLCSPGLGDRGERRWVTPGRPLRTERAPPPMDWVTDPRDYNGLEQKE